MGWWNGEPQSPGGSFIRQADDYPPDGASIASPGFMGYVRASEADGQTWLTGNGIYGDAPPPAAGTSWKTFRNMTRTVWKSGGAFPAGSFVMPTGHIPGHYTWYNLRANDRFPYGKNAGAGSYIVYDDGPVAGYPARPAANAPNTGLGDNASFNRWLQLGAVRGTIEFARPGRAPAALSDQLAAAASNLAEWRAFRNDDPGRPHRPMVISLINVMAEDAELVKGIVTDPRFADAEIYWELGNERGASGFDGGGNLGTSPTTLVNLCVTITNAIRSVRPAAKVAGPSTTEIGDSAYDGMKAFYMHPSIVALNLAAIDVHSYNAHQGDMPCGVLSWDRLLGLRQELKALGNWAGTVPVHQTEAGNMMNTESGRGVPHKQSWQIMLDLFLAERFTFLDPGAGSPKESRIEFHQTNQGFYGHPGWWVGNSGIYLVGLPLLAHSQELFGCAQKPSSLLDVGTDDSLYVIGLEHRRANGTGVLAILCDDRDQRMRLRIPGMSQGQTVTVRDGGMNKRTVTLEANGELDFAPWMARQAVITNPTGPQSAAMKAASEEGRFAVYIRLPAGSGSPVRVDKNTWAAKRIPSTALVVRTNGGSAGQTQITSVVKADVYRNPLRRNGGIGQTVADGIWRTATKLSAAPTEGLWLEVEFPAPKLIERIRFVVPPDWQETPRVNELLFEVWNGSTWTTEKTVNEHAVNVAERTMAVIYNGFSETKSDFNRMWTATLATPRVSTKARVRLPKSTTGPGALTLGACYDLNEWNAYGAVKPVVATDGPFPFTYDRTPGHYPPRWPGQSVPVPRPVPDDIDANPWGHGFLAPASPAQPLTTGYWVNLDPEMWAQDFAVYGTDAGDGGGGGGGTVTGQLRYLLRAVTSDGVFPGIFPGTF